jgi:hypothetical protein
MHRYRLLFLSTILIFSAFSCSKKKKPSLSGNEIVEVSDFIESFPLKELPYQVADTSLRKKDNDSLLISNKVLLQFISDSVVAKIIGKGSKPKMYPLGKAISPDGVAYLFLKTVAGDKKSVLLFAFDKKQKFIAGVPVLKPDNNNLTRQSVTIDKRFSITKNIQQKNADGSISDGKDVYILNEEARNFTLIMTDALGETVTELINPIDTLSRKNKYAADYGPGKMNLVSIRDGRKPDRVTFFVHFDKDNGQCSGELKGEAFWKSATTAEYRQDGDPCVMQFIFTSSSVSIKEENCGSRRNNINCSFDGNFGRRKYIKPAANVADKPKGDKKKPVKK